MPDKKTYRRGRELTRQLIVATTPHEIISAQIAIQRDRTARALRDEQRLERGISRRVFEESKLLLQLLKELPSASKTPMAATTTKATQEVRPEGGAIQAILNAVLVSESKRKDRGAKRSFTPPVLTS